MALGWLYDWGRRARFAGFALAATLSPSSYETHTRALTLRQIYFTAWQILLPFLAFAALSGVIVMEIALESAYRFGLAAYTLELILRFLVLELMPLITALFVALRSGGAIATEIALMQVAGHFEAMRASGRDPLRREFVPRVAAAALSVLALTVISCAMLIALAYPVLYGFTPGGIDAFTRVVGQIFGPVTLAGFALKCVLFGAAVAVIPISAGLEADRRHRTPPIAVRGGMVRLFFVLGLIEVASLAARYIG